MKRLFALFLVMALLFCACDSKEEQKELKIAKTPEEESPYSESVIGRDTEEAAAQAEQAEQEEKEKEEEAPPAPITSAFQPQRHRVCAGAGMTAVLHDDGTVTSNWTENKTEAVTVDGEWNEWSDLVDLSIFAESMIGLRSDGTVVVCGGRTDEKWWSSYTVAHDLSTWKNVVQVSAGIFDYAALMADGSVKVTGSVSTKSLSETTGFTQISMGDCLLALRNDGSVYCFYPGEESPYHTANWTDITQVSAGWDHAVGLKADGTVVATGNNDEGQCGVEAWHDIVQVCAGRQHTIGLCADGTVVTTGLDYYGELDLGEWQDIVEIDSHYNHTVGLKSDGTLVFAGTESAFLPDETIN